MFLQKSNEPDLGSSIIQQLTYCKINVARWLNFVALTLTSIRCILWQIFVNADTKILHRHTINSKIEILQDFPLLKQSSYPMPE